MLVHAGNGVSTPDCFTIPRMLSYLKTCLRALVLAVMACAAITASAAEPVNVAAASDLKFVLEELAADYRRTTGQQVALSFGSSGVFATQIRHGAPFQLYLSADENYVLDLHRDGLTPDTGVPYALGRLALVAPKGGILRVDDRLAGLRSLVRSGGLQRFAIANPEHAPYGRRAVEALQHTGLWSAVKPHLVFGENVSQAAQFASSGSTQGGLVALSLALSSQLGNRIEHAVIPAAWHTPLRQRMVLLNHANEEARAFYAYLQSPAARQVFVRHGFSLPEEQAGKPY
jgi:molybdate transport system substrate-binding protein